MTVPPEAITAAADVLESWLPTLTDGGRYVAAQEALRAAAPLIAAAERDRIKAAIDRHASHISEGRDCVADIRHVVNEPGEPTLADRLKASLQGDLP